MDICYTNYLANLNWFKDNKDLKSKKLINPLGNEFPQDSPFKGIYKPKGIKYVLSIKITESDSYTDGNMFEIIGAGKAFYYDLEKTNKQTVSFSNEAFAENIRDSVPVGVIKTTKNNTGTEYTYYGCFYPILQFKHRVLLCDETTFTNHSIQAIKNSCFESYKSSVLAENSTGLNEGHTYSDGIEYLDANSKFKYWCVRAGKGASRLEEFLSEGSVAIDFKDTINETLVGKTRDQLKERQASINATSQLICFRDLIKVNDIIITPGSGSQIYYLFKITSDYYFQHSVNGFSHKRSAKFIVQVSRDQLTEKLYRSLGTILTVFSPTDTCILDSIVEENILSSA